MSCQVKRDNKGKIIKVLDPQGKESKLFNQIAQLPQVENLEQAVEIYDEMLKANPGQNIIPLEQGVTVSKTDSNNPSFEDMLDIKTQEGTLEIGKIKGAQRYSILMLGVNEDSRRQGVATKLLKVALNRTKGKLSGQASNDKAIGLNYNLGMRAYNKEGNPLSLEETKEVRALSAGESVNMRLPEDQTGDNYTPFQGNTVSDAEATQLGAGFFSNAFAAMNNLKDRAVKNVKGWISQLTDTQKNGNVKNVGQELEWVGLEDFLNSWIAENKPKNGNVPFSVVEQYIKDNRITITEITKGGRLTPVDLTWTEIEVDEEDWQSSVKSYEEIIKVFEDDEVGYQIVQTDEGFKVRDKNRDDVYQETDGYEDGEFLTFEQASRAAGLHLAEQNTYSTEEVKYGNYQLPEGDNYREILLTMPKKLKLTEGNYEGESKAAYKIVNSHNDLIRKRSDGLNEILNSDLGKDEMLNEMEEYNRNIKKEIQYSYDNLPDWVSKKENINIEVKIGRAKEAELEAIERKDDQINSRNNEEYESSHWQEGNVLAHIRLNSRTLPNGERVLFIEEIQSDWAQDGKKRGFTNKEKEDEREELRLKVQNKKDKVREIETKLSNLEPLTDSEKVDLNREKAALEKERDNVRNNRDWNALGEKITAIEEKFNEYENSKSILKSEIYEIKYLEEDNLSSLEGDLYTFDNNNRLTNDTVPNMPYKKTDQWVGMAMRKVLQMATQEGFDRVAWTTGNQNSERYSLSKQVNKIEIDPTANEGIKAVYLSMKDNSDEGLFINTEGIITDSGSGKYIGSKAEEVLGKDLTRKILETTDKTTLEGEDLVLGGDGMKTFYDSIVPKVAKKEAQRFDKEAQVEEVSFLGETSTRNRAELLKLKAELESQDTLSESDNMSLKGVNTALKATKNDDSNKVTVQPSIKLTPKLKAAFLTPTPLFSLESGDNTYPNFKEALDNTEEKTIDIVSNGVVIATFPATLDERTTQGVINSLIVDGILKPNKVIFNGKTYFQTTGETPSDRMISEEFFKDNIKQMISKSEYKVEAGLIEIFPKKELVRDEGSMHQAVTDIVLNYFSGETVINKKAPIDERNLKLNLMKILSDMGVSVMTLKQYQDKFKIKSQDIPPSAEALADIVNRVIAFKDGSLTLDNLTEEVMHLIVETLPAAQIEALSDLVRNSQEYQDNYEKYNKVYKGDQKLLEKEILGKILKNISLNKTESLDKTLLARLYEILKNFFNGLTVSKTHRDQLKQLNSLVEKFVIQQNGESFNEDSLSKSKEIALMYSLSDEISNAQGAFAKTFSNITDFGYLNSYKKELNGNSFENLQGKQLASAVSRLIEMSTKLIETTDAALKTAKSRGKALSGQNLTILKDLDTEIRTTLVALAGQLTDGQSGVSSDQSNRLAEKLSENAGIISELRADNDRTTNTRVKEMVDEVLVQMGQAESEFYRAEVEKALTGQIEDTNYMFSFFGQLHHASNPILNMIGGKIWEMNMKAKQGTLEDAAEYLEYLKANPKLIKELEELFKDGYMTDVVDHKSFEEALMSREMDAFSQISGVPFASLEAYKLAKKEKTLPDLGSKEGNYRTLLQEKQLEIIEPIMSQKYYRDLYDENGVLKPVSERKGLFDKYERLDISGVTQAFLKQNSADRGAIKANASKSYINEDGEKVTRTILSPEDNDNLNSISKIRKARKNIFSEISTKKEGLELSITKPAGIMSVLLATGQYLYLDGTISDEAQISFDLHKLDNAYMEEVQAGNLENTNAVSNAKANFIAYIKTLGTSSNKEMFDTIMSNLDVSLSQEFYDTINGDSFLKGDSLEKLNPNDLDLVENVKTLYSKRNAILSMYRNTSSPFEIDKLTDSDQRVVRDLSENISNALRILNLPEGTSEEEGQTAGEKGPNNAYSEALKKRKIVSGTIEELRFIKDYQHASIANINKIESAFFKSEQGLPLTKSEERMLESYQGSTSLAIQLDYARKNLQAYYTRFAPKGYKTIQERVDSGEGVIEILGNRDLSVGAIGILEDPYLNVRIDGSFEEDNNPLKNPKYKDDYDGGFRQPKEGMFVNRDFISKFGINSNGEATQNKQLYEARRLYIDARKKGLEKMRESGANPYKSIQISKTKTEMIRQSAKGKELGQNIKEIFRETLAYRVDDVAYGVKGFETTKVLPKYYTNDLENAQDVSTDHVYAMAQFLARANEYKAKKEIIPDIDALYDVLVRGKRHTKSKDLKNTIAMADSYIENSIYGKIENRTYEFKVPGTDFSVDLAKVSRVFTKYVSLKNLGFNTTVPLTGYLSGMVSKKVEEYIGEKLNKESAALANAEYKRLFKDGASQALDFQDNSKLFLIGQAFGIYDISEKARNAKYNTWQRTFSKSAMSLHTMANYPIIPKIALAVMFDNRIIGGKIVNKTQYFQEETRAGVAQEKIAAAWKVAEEETMYKHMNFNKTGFTWSDEIKKLIPDGVYLENRKLFMMKFIRNQVSIIDGTLPQEMKIAAQRDVIGSMVMLHKGFLTIFLQNRLKKRHLNIDTALIEEGSYRTLARLMGDFLNTNENGDREMNKKFKKLIGATAPPGPNATSAEWLDYELDMRNMKRIGKEVAAMITLVTLGAFVFAIASDPDNEDNYAMQMTSYLTTRLLNESAASFTPAIITDLSSVIEDPVVAYDSAKEVTQIWKLFDGEEIASGKYKGLSQRQRWLTKNVIGVKGVYDMYGADNIRESEKTYRLYNEENINRSTLYLNALYEQAYKKD